MIISLAFLFSFIALILGFKLHDKFDPARYFTIFWGGQIIIIYTIFHNVFSFTGYGLIYISIASIIFSAGTLFGRLLGVGISKRKYSYTLNDKRALFFLKTLLILSIIQVMLGIYKNGFSIKEILTFNALLELNSSASVSRYTTVTSSSIISKILLVFVYVTPLFGGYLLPLFSKRKKYWCYLSILPSILIALTQAVKLALISSVALWSVGVLVSSYANNKFFIKMDITTIRKILVSFILFLAILFLSMIFRTGKFDVEIIKAISEKFINYAFGHLPAFDLWFYQNVENLKPTGGIKTFYGITNFLGIAERKQGVFSELIYYGKNYSPGLGTNVYTVFRFIIEDFGFIGSYIVLFIAGSISGFTSQKVNKRADGLLFQSILISTLFFVSMSFATSVWAYTSYIATMVLMYFILAYIFSKNKETTLHA